MGRVPPPSQPRGLRTLRPWQPALSQAASSQRCPGSSVCKFQCIARRREGGCPGSKKKTKNKVCTRGAPPSAPVTSPTGARHPWLGGAAKRGGTYPPRPCRCRSLWELLSPELSECKKDGGAYRETTHSSVWQPGGDSGSSALKEEEEEETAQSDAICCTPLRCHWLPGASPGTAGLGPLGATLRLTAPSSCSPPPLPSSFSPPRSPSPLFPSGAFIRPSTRPPPP